jgi:hypothetical protein
VVVLGTQLEVSEVPGIVPETSVQFAHAAGALHIPLETI